MTARFGAFGKMPSLGDFFRVEVPQGFVDPWDRWLQAAIVTARGVLGSRWQDSYLSAPIWRFSLAPGLAGPAPVTGVMMMSVDRVGRQFPLTLVQALPDDADILLWHLTAGDVFAALEAVALDALEDAMTRERLAALLDGVRMPGPPAAAPVVRRDEGATFVAGTTDLVPGLAAQALRGAARHPSIWSADAGAETRLMLSDGLPAGTHLLGLFDLAARVWTGRDAPGENALSVAPPAPEPTPAADLPPASEPPTRVAPPPLAAHVPLEDPLADILGPDDPLFDVSDPDDDPFAAILSAADGSHELDPEPAQMPHPMPDAPQEA